MLILRLMHHGATTFPGKFALKLMPNILTRLSNDVHVICVTGTNGKTTTCAMIKSVLNSNGVSCFCNDSGANMLTGVVTSFLQNSNAFGKCMCDYAILECDENSLSLITSYLSPKIIAVTNVFRDQLDRYGEVNFVLSKIKQGVSNTNSPVLVINADCPITSTLKCSTTITFGINASFDSTSISDICYCPVCNARLNYLSYVYAHLGNFRCPRCGYHRVPPTYLVTSIGNNSITINNSVTMPIIIDGVYNAYNFLCAYAVCKTIGVYDTSALSTFSGAFGRMESFFLDDRVIKLFLVKNPVGYSNCINLVSSFNNKYDMIFALNDNSADGTDVSWIWDVSFAPLSSVINNAHTIGKRSLDMAVRLKYDDIIPTPILGEDYNKMLDVIRASSLDVVIFSTYTSMMNMRHYLVDSFGGKEFWQ